MALLSRICERFLGSEPDLPSQPSQKEMLAAMRYAQLIADRQNAGWEALSYAHPIRQITERSYACGVEHEAQLLVFHLNRPGFAGDSNF